MVEEEGEIDVIISREFLEQEKAKLEQLKGIAAEARKISSTKGAGPGAKLASKEAAEESKKQAKLVADLKKKVTELEKQQRAQDSKIKGFFSKAGQLATNPQAFVTDAVSSLFQSTRMIPILAAAVGFSVAIFKLIEREFADGGLFDLRVKVHDIVRSIVGLKNLIDIESGVVFMSPDTRITTMPPETSNTESLRDGHVRYNQLTLGYR